MPKTEIKCPRCKNETRMQHPHWHDPLIQCRDKNCAEYGQLKRVSSLPVVDFNQRHEG